MEASPDLMHAIGQVVRLMGIPERNDSEWAGVSAQMVDALRRFPVCWECVQNTIHDNAIELYPWIKSGAPEWVPNFNLLNTMCRVVEAEKAATIIIQQAPQNA